MTDVRVTGLAVHPVKSMAGRAVEVVDVLLGGLVTDRSWGVVDADGIVLTAREERALLSITADTPATDSSLRDGLRLRAAGLPDLSVATPTGATTRAKVHSQELQGIPAGADADAWVREVLGRDDVRLVWCDDPTRRTLNPAHSRPEDFTAYADGYPVTIASESSLRQLNDWIAEGALERGEEPPVPLPMQRFRPNIVVDSGTPFAEDDWRSVVIGEVVFRVAKPVDRCVMTTIDPVSLSTGREPIRTLARHRLVDQLTMFAIHLIPETTGRISVGDPVEVG